MGSTSASAAWSTGACSSMVLVSAANATSRYALDIASNAWLELQWYLFSAVFLLCAGYTLLHNEHIRIDIVSSLLSRRTQIWIDVFGTLFFLLPMAIYILWLSWPIFVNAWTSGEISGSAGGLVRWPARLLVPVGFFLLTLQGDLGADQAHRLPAGPDPRPGGEARRPGAASSCRSTESQRSDRVPHRQHGAADVRGAGRLPAARLSGRVRARRARACSFGFIGIELGLLHPGAVSGAARAHLRHHVERHAARGAVLHLHGADPRAQRHGRGPARHHRPAVRADPRRPRLRGDLRRRAARRDHRRRRRLGDLDGPDLAADHAALRLRPAPRERRDRRLGHARADHPAVAGADRARRPARPLGRRHVRGRDLPGPGAHRPVRPATSFGRDARAPGSGAGPAAGGAPAARLAACSPRGVRADPAARADLPRARHDLPRRRDADRGRRHGRDRRARARARSTGA